MKLAEHEHWLDRLVRELDRKPPNSRHQPKLSNVELDAQAMVEAFCSNNIDGSAATWEQVRLSLAENITERRPARISKDVEDVERTYAVIKEQMEQPHRCPENEDGFIEHVQAVHVALVGHRPQLRPGKWKDRPNFAGTRLFARPKDVEEMMRSTFRAGQRVAVGMPRAIVIQFGFITAHPFADANGRTSRVLLNSELTRAGEARCVLTQSGRQLTVGAAELLMNKDKPSAMGAAWEAVQKQTLQLNWSEPDELVDRLQREGEILRRKIRPRRSNNEPKDKE